MASILDPKFKYVPAAKTDISKTFARIKKEMDAAKNVIVLKVKNENKN